MKTNQYILEVPVEVDNSDVLKKDLTIMCFGTRKPKLKDISEFIANELVKYSLAGEPQTKHKKSIGEDIDKIATYHFRELPFDKPQVVNGLHMATFGFDTSTLLDRIN
jgi:hypothetical protein